MNGLGTRSPVLALGMLVFRHRQPLSAAGVTDWLAPEGPEPPSRPRSAGNSSLGGAVLSCWRQ